MTLKSLTKYIIIGLALILVLLIIDQIFPATNKLSSATVVINNQTLAVEVAATPAEQYQGLSNRPSLCTACGMLFIFPNLARRQFVMRNMKFPLDIIWIQGHKIMKIDYNLPPEGPDPSVIYSAEDPVNYVLEVNSGWAEGYGLNVGDTVEIKL